MTLTTQNTPDWTKSRKEKYIQSLVCQETGQHTEVTWWYYSNFGWKPLPWNKQKDISYRFHAKMMHFFSRWKSEPNSANKPRAARKFCWRPRHCRAQFALETSAWIVRACCCLQFSRGRGQAASIVVPAWRRDSSSRQLPRSPAPSSTWVRKNNVSIWLVSHAGFQNISSADFSHPTKMGSRWVLAVTHTHAHTHNQGV